MNRSSAVAIILVRASDPQAGKLGIGMDCDAARALRLLLTRRVAGAAGTAAETFPELAEVAAVLESYFMDEENVHPARTLKQLHAANARVGASEPERPADPEGTRV